MHHTLELFKNPFLGVLSAASFLKPTLNSAYKLREDKFSKKSSQYVLYKVYSILFDL